MPNRINTQIERIRENIADAYTAALAKGATMPPIQNSDNLMSSIETIPEGSISEEPEKDVNFIDYDGRIVYSYTASEFAAMTAMPPNPSHDGLTAQGWNWSFGDAQIYVSKYGRLWVGQMYITDDGKTRIYIHLEEGRTSPKLGVCAVGTVTVNWGDDTTPDTLLGTNINNPIWTPNHNYSTPGDYVIELTASGQIAFYGNTTSNQLSGILRYSETSDLRNNTYRSYVKRIEIGNGFTSLNDNSIRSCYSLQTITLPNTLTSIGNGCFYTCYSLKSITIPSGVTAIGNSEFYSCECLNRVSLSNTISEIGTSCFSNCHNAHEVDLPEMSEVPGQAFNNCYNMRGMIIPDTVSTISGSVFTNCYNITSIVIPSLISRLSSTFLNGCGGMKKITFMKMTPPSITSSSMFADIPTDCIIHVPKGALSVYTKATNYPNPNTYTYVEDE